MENLGEVVIKNSPIQVLAAINLPLIKRTMKKLVIRGRESNRVKAKGLTVKPDEIHTLDELLCRLRTLFNDATITG